jgi:signal transduction histidine kinase/DNA-binding response OmpR family regulator
MPSVRAFVQRLTPKTPLYVQLLGTAMAFLAMAVLSYAFMSKIVHGRLIQNTRSVLDFVQAQIDYELTEPMVSLGSFSQSIRGMVLRGDNAARLQLYLDNIPNHLGFVAQRNPSFIGIFAYLETLPGGPALLGGGLSWNAPGDYIPTERAWYREAVAANGRIATTLSYTDIVSDEIVLMYSVCIYDDEGHQLGVVAQRVRISAIADSVVKTALDRGGYGVLLSDDFIVLAHPNGDFVGKHVSDPELPFRVFADEMEAGLEISERPLITYRHEKAVAFFRQLSNGWYLGVVTPRGPYYRSVINMGFILGLLGAVFAAMLIVLLVNIDAARSKSDKESKHKSAFLANMSHEIRTPMNAIIGMTTIGKSSADTERKNYCFLKIEDASNHLLGLINDILDMSKIEANKFELSPVEFNFEKMLQRVVNVINFRVEEKQQKLMVHIDRAIPNTLVGDDQRIAQVIANLLSNAVKFTPEKGSVTLETQFLGEADGICSIQIAITDTGIGISAAQQEKLFQSFHQAEISTTRKFGGTGLGLAISKSIVELMGGKIWVQSELGHGATFAFAFQVKRGERKKQSLLTQDVHWGNLRIMVVDDDKDILVYFNEITQGFGLSCDTALSAAEALRLVEQNGNYHIYFVDWKMPDTDGIQLASELETRTPKDSVVIMISAAEWTTVEGEAKKAGVDKFLSKPLFPSDIADAINEVLGFDGRHKDEEEKDINGIFAGRHILLAEDVEINREIVQALLEPSQVGIDCAENGAQAVRIFSGAPEKYDLIFMDLHMPEMDGYDATRAIRALDAPRAQTVPIIAMTANVFREDVEKCLEVGMNSHVGKPLVFGEVINVMLEYLGNKPTLT